MLHRLQEQHVDEGGGELFTPSYFFDLFRRRAFYFAIPFLLALAIGTIITFAWPAKYLAEGKILITSQEIPTDLVRPTVGTLANERIQIIEQRIMTRDNLIAIAKKFRLSAGWRGYLGGTDISDFIRERTQIKPLALSMQGQVKQAIAFTVGFEYENPQIATQVANELVTMILNEDVRTRTNYATETTRFLEQDVKRLESQLSLMDNNISQLKRAHPLDLTDTSQLSDAKELSALRAQLLLMSATYSDSHPNIRALKRKIEALEKSAASAKSSEKPPTPTGVTTAAAQDPVVAANANSPGLGTLEAQRASLKTELEGAHQKLAAARLGEGLERGQHSARLEVIEQPSPPKQPFSPNRPKIFAIAFIFALMAGGGVAFGAEMLNPAIRRSSDLFFTVDRNLIVAIPYITTRQELRSKKNKIKLTAGIIGLLILVIAAIAYFVLPPLDLVFDKVMTILLR